jgi:iron complex transport system ATP-binding protein
LTPPPPPPSPWRTGLARRAAGAQAIAAEGEGPLLEVRDIHFRHGSGPVPGAGARGGKDGGARAGSVGARDARDPGEALRGVTLRVAAGEVVGLVGPNAAGKSTLARIGCGLLVPASGEVLLRGDPVARLPRRERARRVAFLAQHQPSDLPFTAREVALMGRAPHLGLWSLEGEGDHARAEAALQELDALDLAERPVSQLSGGERQRVFLARAFAQEARLLVLDEPTASLDLSHQVLLVNAVRRRARAGGGALLVLHDLAIAGSACDRLALLVAGRVAAEGTCAQVLRPEVLSAAYGTQVDVVADPATGALLVTARVER